MGLIDLKSNLSWYGKKPGPYKPNKAADDTKFTNESNIPGVSITGYADNRSVTFRQIQARDSFAIDNVSYSSRGLASRTNQGGEGFPFLNDKGWSADNEYGSVVKKLSTAGLADRYTKNSPIDDQYNKFKVRDESHNNSPYFREPLVLRGIQRNGKSDNQRYGFSHITGFDSGLTRGGIITNTVRSVIDGIRIGKWLTRPEGLVWNLKQFGLQFSNRNVQGVGGRANPLALTKIYDPTSVLVNTLGAGIGVHANRHMPPIVPAGKYGDIVKPDQRIVFNRLAHLKKELLDSDSKPAAGVDNFLSNIFGNNKLLNMLGFGGGQTIRTLTALGGPGTLYGLGQTTIRRYENTIPNGETKLQGLGISKFDQNNTFGEYFGRMYHIGRRYAPAGTSTTNVGFDGSNGQRGDESERSILGLHSKLYGDGLGYTPPLIDNSFSTYANEIKLGDGLSALNGDKINFRNNRKEQYATGVAGISPSGNKTATYEDDGRGNNQKDIDNQFGGLKYKRGDRLEDANSITFGLTDIDSQFAVHSEAGGIPTKGDAITKADYIKNRTTPDAPYEELLQGDTLTEKEKNLKQEAGTNLRYGKIGEDHKSNLTDNLSLTSLKIQTSKFSGGTIPNGAPAGLWTSKFSNDYASYTTNRLDTFDSRYSSKISLDAEANGTSVRVNVGQLYEVYSPTTQKTNLPLLTNFDAQLAVHTKLGGLPDGEGRFINPGIFAARATYSNKYFSIGIAGAMLLDRENQIKAFGGGLLSIYEQRNPFIDRGPVHKQQEDGSGGGILTGLGAQLANKPLNSFNATTSRPLDISMIQNQNDPDAKYSTIPIGTKNPNPTVVEAILRQNITHGILQNAFLGGLEMAVNPGTTFGVNMANEEDAFADVNKPSTKRGAIANPIKAFGSMAYQQIAGAAANKGANPSAIIDFRKKLDDQRTMGIGREQDSKDDSVLKYASHVVDETGNIRSYQSENIETKYNIPKSGAPGRIRAMRMQNNMPDLVNQIPFSLDDSKNFPGEYKQGNGSISTNSPILKKHDKDFINFKFYPVTVGKKLKQSKSPIIFRAFIDDISDNITPTWTSAQDQGRADAKIMLGSWERAIDVNFKVAATSAVELQHLYNKMEALAQCAYPDYEATHGFTGRYVKVHIGNLYKNEPMYITNISFSWDNETPWELSDGLQVPYYTLVNMSLGWIGNMRPDASRSKVFSVGSRNLKAGSKFKAANDYIGYNKNKPVYRSTSDADWRLARPKIGSAPDY